MARDSHPENVYALNSNPEAKGHLRIGNADADYRPTEVIGEVESCFSSYGFRLDPPQEPSFSKTYNEVIIRSPGG